MGKGSNTQVWKYYAIEGNKIRRLRRECPRCGRGVFMAEHSDRVTCGRCNYTEFKRKDRERDRDRERQKGGKGVEAGRGKGEGKGGGKGQ
ncbi:MAG: 30S ribosomal protein S27ae [Candidatus Nitrosocaldus sp.]|nr:30S ribosomal protein S27ae [Candidatus Nitrosocaldus sp.]MCS7141886.1 30S ribosomal protein S27ae [Candidatus Nitrosocaldus sp.]MDW8000401.1 30S ribosomal protein S27ae [Candidatus Nitrosocaldus sp.]MDW8275239.1 30S ribosomal protein S27ae [Candidatus Nitrosocaldus sp.]